MIVQYHPEVSGSCRRRYSHVLEIQESRHAQNNTQNTRSPDTLRTTRRTQRVQTRSPDTLRTTRRTQRDPTRSEQHTQLLGKTYCHKVHLGLRGRGDGERQPSHLGEKTTSREVVSGTYVCVYVCANLNLLSVCISVYWHICLQTCLSVCLYLLVSAHRSVCLLVCLSVHQSVSIFLRVYLLPGQTSKSLPDCLSACLFLYRSINQYISVCLHIYLCVRLSACLSASLCVCTWFVSGSTSSQPYNSDCRSLHACLSLSARL